MRTKRRMRIRNLRRALIPQRIKADRSTREMKDFIKEYEPILRMALTSGVPVLSRERHRKWPPEFAPGEYQNFVRSCHRGFDRAQSSVLRMLKEIHQNDNITKDEQLFRALLLRKVIDSIVYTLLRQEIHVMKRLVIHSSPPPVNMHDLKRVMRIVDDMNSESRLTFAVAADLSTCVHVCDIVRIDHRARGRVELIEVKSGKCNAILSSFLDKFPAETESLPVIKSCQLIPQHLRKQANRMMRQRVRLSQALEVKG